jgi:hypothetical protein
MPRAGAAERQQCRCAARAHSVSMRRLTQASLAHVVGRCADRADRRQADGNGVVAGDLGLLSVESDRRRRHRPHARSDRVGAPAFHRERARVRTAADDARRPSAVRLCCR